MAPILVDNRGQIKLGLTLVLTMVIVFAAGFLSGHQQAATFYATDSKIEPLVLPVAAVVLEAEVGPQLPDTIVAGADIDVDQPQTDKKNAGIKSALPVYLNKEKVSKTNAAPASTRLVSLQPAIIESPSREQTGSLNDKAGSADITMSNRKNRFSIEKPSLKNRPASADVQNESGDSVTVKKQDLIMFASLTSTELSKVKYSIQVGMYGRLINAENMMRMLQAQHLGAYVSDYTSKNNQIRYNVRFGYFADKKSARGALKNYKNKQKGDGYLVNFSVENITKLADATDLEQSTTTELVEKKLLPVSLPLESNNDNVSRVDVINAQAILGNI